MTLHAPPCLACPRMCDFACPAVEVSGREAFAPWVKGALSALSTGGGDRPAAATADAFYSCTTCRRCIEHCPHGFDLVRTVRDARAGLARAGNALPAIASLADRFGEVGHGEEIDLLHIHRELPARLRDRMQQLGSTLPPATGEPRGAPRPGAGGRGPPSRGVQLGLAPRIATRASTAQQPALLFAGCEALAAGGGSAVDALAVAEAVGAPLQLAGERALCCGLKLLDAGHPERFAAHAARTVAELAGSGRQARRIHLVLLSAACTRAVSRDWPAFGAALPPGSRVEHVTTFLARAIGERPALASRPRLPGAVTWHDPCQLSRGLGELSAPRALLAAAVAEVREPPRRANDTSCCGAGGLLPRTMPELSQELARNRQAELRACGAPVVTACPGCARQLGAEELSTLLARWLGVA